MILLNQVQHHRENPIKEQDDDHLRPCKRSVGVALDLVGVVGKVKGKEEEEIDYDATITDDLTLHMYAVSR